MFYEQRLRMTDKKLKIALHTLGCKLNFSESSTIARQFETQGYERVPFTEKADIYVVNSCTVTQNADKKCRQAVRKIYKQNPDAFVAVVGCYAQVDGEAVATIPGVDAVFGVNDKFKLLEFVDNLEKNKEAKLYSCEIDDVEHFDAAFSSGDRTRSFLKVQDGCDYACTYCIIPKARGKSRNNDIVHTIAQAQEVAKLGYKEIVLTGVNIGDFGRSTGENFIDLIEALDQVEGIERYRISSIEPNLLSHSIIEFVAQSKRFLPHFHIPLQSGNDQILAKMKRRYNRTLFADRIQKIKQTLPNAFIGVDVIVGFPGESDADFLDTYNFLESLEVSFLHVFSYSDRPNTPTASMTDKVYKQEIARRSKKLHELSEIKHRYFYSQNIGKEETVLFEAQQNKGFMHGFTSNYLKVECAYDEKLVNRLAKVHLLSIKENSSFEIKLV